MRWLAFLLAALIVALQYPMWLGKGGWLQVRDLERQLNVQRDANAALKARNERLDADVRDLKTGFEAIEERARAELGMVRQEEVFFQLQHAPVPTSAAAAQAKTGPPQAGGPQDRAKVPSAPPAVTPVVPSRP
ncbi:MAG: cell division protein FtsB [Casimicrobiaceae bacterium]